jgi:hypothetical protein
MSFNDTPQQLENPSAAARDSVRDILTKVIWSCWKNIREKIFNDIEVIAFDGDMEEVATKSGVVAKPTTMPLDIEQTFPANIYKVISILQRVRQRRGK